MVLPVAEATREALDAAVETAVRAFAEAPIAVACEGRIAPGHALYRIDTAHDGAHFDLAIEDDGVYAVFCEHAPAEFGLRITGSKPVVERAFASHHHDEEISSIGITDDRPLDAKKVNDWFSYLLQSRGADIFRMKGVLHLAGESRRYVFHGVHMMFDGKLERPWPANQPRRNTLVFIGRKLDRAELEAGFASCVA